MLDLVSAGCENIAIQTTDSDKLTQWLSENFPDSFLLKPGFDHNFTLERNHARTLIFIDSAQNQLIWAVSKSAEQILSLIYNEKETGGIIEHIQALPRAIFFNVLKEFGDIKAAKEKIASEFTAQTISFAEIKTLAPDTADGTLVYFLYSDDKRLLLSGTNCLYIEQSYHATLNYLHIHAPRYLAKAYPIDSWHLVTIRMQDNYEKYNAQYARLLKAIELLDLGYIANEQWNRELSPFAEPLGTYGMRLITFMPPLKLKLMLMALEYDTNGNRLVNLDLYYHDKRISWHYVSCDKEYRKLIKGTEFQLPKSIFFAAGDDKAKTLNYAQKLLKEALTTDELATLVQYEAQIRD